MANIIFAGMFLLLASFHASAHEGDSHGAPIEFIRNEGQWKGPFAYRATFGNVDLFLEKNAFTYLVGAADNYEKQHQLKYGGAKEPMPMKYHAYRMRMIGANTNTDIKASKPQSHYYNYYYGSDASKWKDFIYPNLSLDYENIYNGVDLHVASEGASVKYDFIVEPGASAEQIQLQFEGVDKISISKNNLVLATSVGDIYEMAPYAYQYINGSKKTVSCNYRLKDNIVTYNFPKGYDQSATLIIDPNVVFSTFSGSTARNWGFTATYDDSGNFYAGGIANNTGYPTTLGPTFIGGDGADGNASAMVSDMTITKFNPTGSALAYSTYIGGSSQDQPHSMVVNSARELYIAGRTYSADFPDNGNGTNHSGKSDIIVIKLNAAGGLITSRFMGGAEDDGVNISSVFGTVQSLKHSYADDARSEIILDRTGNVYVAGSTKSTDFPLVNANKSSLTGAQDGVVFKLNSALSTALWSTYVGGNNNDACYVLALNNAQSTVYVAGGTASNDFAGSGGLWNTYQGGSADGFIQRYQNSGSYALQGATLIGRNNYDQVFGIQIDDQDNVYVMGQTLGGTFPVTTGVYSNALSSQFLMKLNPTLNTNIYSTVFGSGNSSATNITPVAFLVDTCQNVYISGWGGAVASNGGNTNGMPVQMGNPPPTPANIMSANTDGNDFYFIVFSKNAVSVLFAAYFGGTTTGEHVDGGTSRFDKNGVVYQAICGGCFASSAVPTTANVYSNVNRSNDNCNLMALKIAFNLGSVSAKATAQPNTSVCLGDPVTFSSAGSANVVSYDWQFGDGNSSTAPSPTHTYATGGTFQVRLVTINPNACITHDTAFLSIKVDTNSINADFDAVPSDKCKPYIATITNKSRTRNGTTYQWNFGDGKTFNGQNPVTHTYADTGTYTIRLTITDPQACNPVDTVSKTITFNIKFVEAGLGGPPVICEKTNAVFNNTSVNGATYLWSFGDGSTSTLTNPSHVYDTAGTYKVKLIAYNPNTCNRIDSVETTVRVETTPVASFRHEPIIPVTNEPITFKNQSLRATAYVWDFGDNTGSNLETPEPKYYRRTGTYRVCLQALNAIGCSDTVCRSVDADVYPLADLPKAFSPNGDGKNDILYVRGSGIEVLDLKLYNRWGQVVFETTDVNIGWDGKYKGKEQPMEAYGYVMNVTFIDGTTFFKKGNVTLLR